MRSLQQFKMDKNRMLVILLTRLFMRLILKARQAINQQKDLYVNALDQFYHIAQEFLLMPVIAHDRIA